MIDRAIRYIGYAVLLAMVGLVIVAMINTKHGGSLDHLTAEEIKERISR